MGAWALAWALAALPSSDPRALTDEDIYAGFRIPFAAPGGRAAAMGGAGLALVDDPAAARLNPSRLAAISLPEVVIELGTTSFPGESDSSGLLRFDAAVNPYAGASFDTASAADGEPSLAFLALAWPLPSGSKRVVIALSRAEALNLAADARSANRTTPLSAPVAPSAGDEVLRISNGRLDADLVLYDLAAGWRLTPTFEVGAALTIGQLDLSTTTVGSLADPLQFTGPGMHDPRFSGPAAAPLVRTECDGSDTDIAGSIGVWWKPGPAIALATVFRQGARFGVTATSRDLSTGARRTFTNVVRQPDAAAAGIAWTPFFRSPASGLQSLTFVLDIERVRHSDLLDGMRAGENVLTRRDFVDRVVYDAKDVTEGRLGAEYRRSFPGWTLALRGGLHTRSDGGPFLKSASGDVGALQGQSRALEEGGFFAERDAELHGTAGVGARFLDFTFDIAFDMSASDDRVVASVTYRLPRERP